MCVDNLKQDVFHDMVDLGIVGALDCNRADFFGRVHISYQRMAMMQRLSCGFNSLEIGQSFEIDCFQDRWEGQ